MYNPKKIDIFIFIINQFLLLKYNLYLCVNFAGIDLLRRWLNKFRYTRPLIRVYVTCYRHTGLLGKRFLLYGSCAPKFYLNFKVIPRHENEFTCC